MGKLSTFIIVGRQFGHHDTAKIMAANGRSALKQFLKFRYGMNTGNYDLIKDGENWHMVSSDGSDFEAVPMEE